MGIESLSKTLTKTWVHISILVVLVWGVYANSLHNPFNFDDWHVIPQNPAVRGPENIPSFFVDLSTFSLLPGNRDYRPVFLTSMALAWWVGNGATLPFHLMSVTLHMGNVLLLYFLCRRMGNQNISPSHKLSPSENQWAAWLAAGLFALHPLASESINYISSQSVPLSVFFYLLSFYLFLGVYGSRPLNSATRKWSWLVCSYLFYALALLSKPIAISLLLVLFLWELVFGRPDIDTPVSRWKRYGLRTTKYLPYIGISLVYLAIRETVFSQPFGGSQPIRSAFVHYLTQTKALVFYYLKLAFLPFGQNVDREFALSTSLLDIQVILAIFIILGIAWLLFHFRHERTIIFWSFWFPIGLLLTTYGVILRQVVNEHRAYLSLAGFCVLGGLLIVRLWGAFPLQVAGKSIGIHWGKPITVVIVMIIFLNLGLGTSARNQVWSSDLTLWEDAALHGGTWRAHMNYGLALEEAGRKDEALFQFEEAVRLGPYAFAHLNLGFAHIKRHNMEKGLKHLRTAVDLWPNLPEAHLYLAYGLGENGNFIEAEREFLQALTLRPNYLKGYQFLATFYEKQGRISEAILALKKLEALDPGQGWVGNRIALLRNRQPSKGTEQLFAEAFAYQKEGRRSLAIQRYEQLLKIAPNHRQANFNLAYAYLHGNNPTEWSRGAILFQKVIKLDPNYSEAFHHLAAAYWKLGKRADAVFFDQQYLEHATHSDLKKRSEERLAKEGVALALKKN